MSEFTFIKIATLTEMLNDKSRPAAELQRLAEILSFVAERLRFPVEHPRGGATQEDIQREVQVQKMLLVSEISQWWYQPEDVMWKTVTENGGTYRVVVSKKYHGPQAPKDESPIPAIVKSFSQPETTEEPIASPEEKKYLTFDERFAPAEVARRVAAIEREAAEFRRQREEGDERRGFSL